MRMLLGIYSALASGAAASVPVNTPQSIDFSILDTVVGGVAVLAVLIVVGAYLLFKGWVKFGSFGNPEKAEPYESNEIRDDRGLRRADRLEIKAEFMESLTIVKELISELRNDIKTYLREQQECQRMLPEKYVQWEIFNRMLSEIKLDRKERWEKFDSHKHDDHSGVVIFKK